MTEDKLELEDMQALLRLEAFHRFLFRVIQEAGIFSAQTDGSVGRDQFNLGRRNLGLTILDMAERGQPTQSAHPAGPLITLIQAMRAETQKPTEDRNEKRKSSHYDRTADVAPRDDDDEDDANRA